MKKRKIYVSLAISLDGYIADTQGGYSWIQGSGNTALNTPNKWNFAQFLQGIDVVVMGRQCYDQNMHLDFADKQVYVASRKTLPPAPNLHVVHSDIEQTILSLASTPGKDIFIFGGGKLLSSFLNKAIIDEYIIGIIPIILGDGIPLFPEKTATIPLTLTQYAIEDGITILYYQNRATE